ncbi:MAG: ribonuclease HII [Patescibacteria group bacterium]
MVKYLIGIDEVGRGPLAGPVTVCAFCLPISLRLKYSKNLLKDFRDSKKLSSSKREKLSKIAHDAALKGFINFSISSMSADYIDTHGISKAVRVAISKCLKKLNLAPKECQVMLDGLLHAPKEYAFQKTVIRGDQKIKVISCASVVAKVYRDAFMVKMDKKYSNYGFKNHKGYGTEEHISMIKKYGPSKIHRLTFLKNVL